MKNIFEIVVLYILGFFILKLPTGSEWLSGVFNYIVALSFVLSLIPVINEYRKLDKYEKCVYFFISGMILYLIVVRLYKGYPLSSNVIVKGFLYDITLVNVFMFYLKTRFWAKLNIINYILISYVIINFVTIVLYPNGWYSTEVYDLNWFLGYKNVMVRTLLPALTISGIMEIHKKGKIGFVSYFLYVICLISVILAQSATSFVMLIVFGLCILFVNMLKKIEFFGLIYSFLIPSVFSILVVFFSFQENLSFVLDYLDRDSTLTGRLYIWKYVINMIANSPLFGFGYHTANEWKFEIFIFFDRFYISHPHNFLLYYLIQGGFFYLFSLIVLLIIISYSTRKNRSSLFFAMLTSMYFSLFVGGIDESLTGCPLFYPLLSFHLPLNSIITRHSKFNIQSDMVKRRIRLITQSRYAK